MFVLILFDFCGFILHVQPLLAVFINNICGFVKEFVKTSQIAIEFCDFQFFKMAAGLHLGFCFSPKNDVMARCGLPMTTSTPYLVKISDIAAELWRFSF